MIRQRAFPWATLSMAMVFSAVQFCQAQSLRFDVDDRAALDPVNTEPGFEQFVIEGMENDDQATTTRTFGDVEVTIAHSNSSVNLYGDRRRGEPTNAGAFTDQELLRDFVFARGESPDDGLDITIANLAPDSAYNVRIWSYDTSSNGVRTSDWFANGVLVMDDYAFDGNDVPPDPVDNDVYAFEFGTVSDATGTVLIEGRAVTGGGCCGVFLNALSIMPDEEILIGDFTGDGVVNEDDFNKMAGNMFGHLDGITGHENGDINLDGQIDLADFHQFVESFPAAAAAAQAIPEPSTFALGIVGLIGLAWFGRRRKRG